MLRINQNRVAALLACAALSACGVKEIKPEERDTKGQYDGAWVGEVSAPRAKTVNLPGNWIMNCDWEPFEVYFVVDDGWMQLGSLEQKFPVAEDGRFRVQMDAGQDRMIGGIMSGNARSQYAFYGDISGDEPSGRYANISPEGAETCTGNFKLSPYKE